MMGTVTAQVWRFVAGGFAALVLMAVGFAAPAFALNPISVSPDQDRVEITSLGEFYESRGDSLQLEMAAATDAVSGRMTVRAVTPGTNPNWVAFALKNSTDKPIERWLTAERYTMFGSGAIWPDLDARRIEAVTPSLGFVPERIKNDRADIFRITLEPGQTITYVAELSTERFARVYMWKPLDYESKAHDRQLFNGVLLGLTGLLAIFLTAVFAANHKIIFPSAALVAWCVLAYLTVDFGFFHKLFQLRPEDNAIYRAATESAMAASLVMFLHTFLKLGQAPSLVRMLLGLWIAGQIALVGVAVVDPRLASTFARLSFPLIGGIGALATGFLALRGRDRALALVPTWLLFLVWVLAAAVILTGRLSTDIAVSGLIAGLVLIVVLIGFTVTQFAFRSIEPAFGMSLPGEQQLSALAVDGAGAAVFQWQTKRNEVKVSSFVEGRLGLAAGELSGKLADFLKHVHEADRERLRLVMAAVQDRAGAGIATQFRLRHADNSMHWFDLQASNIAGPEQREAKFVGLLRDVTDARRAQERLVHDAVYCTLTGMPNRALFLDRLSMMMARARGDERVRPAILLIDLDKFKAVNTEFGLPVGDGLLLTIARRLQRQIGSADSLARVGGDQFAILMEAEKDPADFAREAERIRRVVRAPIRIAGKDIVITASLGLAIHDGVDPGADLLADAEIAAIRAKRAGTDRIELFHPDMRKDRDRTAGNEAALSKALEKGQVKVLYQPVIYLPTEELAGFSATARFEHPDLGTVDPLTLAGSADGRLKARVLTYLLTRAAQDGVRWQKELPRAERVLFVSVNVRDAALLTLELTREVRQVLDQRGMPAGSLRLELPERVVMENPELADEILEQLRASGADLVLDGFGAGYTSISFLQRFAFDTFKIDSALVQASGGGEGAGAAVVRSMAALSHELSRKVAADGVEEPEDAAFLRSIGCAFAQGFYYGDPMPDKDVLQLLKLVRKAERKLEPAGLFRLSAKRKPKMVQPRPDVVVAAAGTEAVRPATAAGGQPGLRRRAVRKPAGTGAEANGMPSSSLALMLPPGAPNPGYGYDMGGPPPQPADSYEQPVPPPPPPLPLMHNPLSSLQAGLDALNGRADTVLAPQAQLSYPPGAYVEPMAVPRPDLDQLAAALSGGANGDQSVAAIAAAVEGNGGRTMAVPPAAKVEPLTRLRTAKPPDLSKLPPGLAASLSRLAGGGGATSGPANGMPPALPRVKRKGA